MASICQRLRVPHHAYSYLPYIQNPVVFSNLLDNFGWRAYAWKYIPFFKNAEFNSKLGVIQLYTLLKSRFDPRTKETEFDRSGSRLIDRPFSDRALNTFTNRIWSVEALPQRYFLELIEAAKANHLRVTMIMLPEYYPIVERQLNRKEILDFYKSVAASNGVPFIRFDQDDIAHDQSLFFNINHLNRRGAMQFSDRLAQRLAGMQPRKPRHNRRRRHGVSRIAAEIQ